MSTIDNYISGTIQPKEDVKAYGNKELTQNDFMTLLSAQLQHQDPMKPMENGEFIAEMAQFSELENSKNLNKAFERLSNTLMSSGSLQASLLVGKNVSFESNQVKMNADGVKVHAKDAMIGDSRVDFHNEAGELVHSAVVASKNGKIEYHWPNEEELTGNIFSVSIQHSRTEESYSPLVIDRVRSVDVSGTDLSIELANGGNIRREDLIEIIEN